MEYNPWKSPSLLVTTIKMVGFPASYLSTRGLYSTLFTSTILPFEFLITSWRVLTIQKIKFALYGPWHTLCIQARKQPKSSTDSTQHLRISSLAPSPWDSGGVVPKVLPTERSCAVFSTAAVNEHGYHGLVVQCQYHGQVLGLRWQCCGHGGGGLEMGWDG